MIYVDDLQLYPGKGWRCHMATDDDLDELHTMAAEIGLRREWFQDHERCPHYDLPPSKRGAVVRMGACEVEAAQLWKRCNTKSLEGIIGKHKDSITPPA